MQWIQYRGTIAREKRPGLGELGVTEMRCRNDLEQQWRRPRVDKDGI